MVIGRSSEAQIQIDHETVSKRHAEIFHDPYGRWWIRDLNSRNGVRFQGARVSERVLRAGDRVRIGDFYLSISEADAPAEGEGEGEGGGDAEAAPDSGAVVPATGARPDSFRRYIPHRPPPRSHAPQVTLVDESPSSICTLNEGQSPRLSAEQLSYVIDLGRRLLETADVQQRRQMLCTTLLAEAFRSNTAMVLRVPRGRATATPPAVLAHSAPQRPGASTAIPHISRSVLGRAVQVMQPILASNAPSLGPVDAPITIAHGRAEIAAVACPLLSDDNTVELLYVLLPPSCGTSEWLALISLCAGQYQQAAAVWAERSRAVTDALIDEELKKAKLIQGRLVPKVSAIERCDMGIGYRPCRWVGGDYLDVIQMSDGKECLIAIADVCGKGLQAALVAGTMHSIVHTAAAVQLPPLNVLMDHLNTYLMTNFSGISYATCALMRLDLEDGKVECLNAGHLPPIIIARDGTPRRMPIGDHMPLGLDGQEWIIQQDRLEEGEWLGLTTDGVTELTRSDGSMLRLDGWEQTLRECVQKLQPSDGASELAAKLMTTLDVQGENATPQDDRTFLVARRRTSS